MLTVEQRRRILRDGMERQLGRILVASEALAAGTEPPATLRSQIQRAFHKIKTDADAAEAHGVAEFAGHLERAAEAAGRAEDFDLDLALVDEALDALAAARTKLPKSDPVLGKRLMNRARTLGKKARARLRGDLTPS